MTDQSDEPNWDNAEEWDEFEWEKTFKYSEHLSASYFELLNKFGDLPGADDYITQKLGDRFPPAMEDSEVFQNIEVGGDAFSLEDGDVWEDGDDEGLGVYPGHPLFYESTPVFIRARQLALGWSNVLASVIQPHDKMWGLEIQLYLGRIMTYSSLCIGDGTYQRPNSSIAFCKRILYQINMVIGKIDEKKGESANYNSMFKKILQLLLETHDLTVGLLQELRNHDSNDSAGK
ncbi:MAG: hypothetical protein MK193_06295 [Lentisphaeria bacterium]|nr:hypothetical protein [Lentisphaeria bacterium]